MAYDFEDEDVECEIIESYGKFSEGQRNWNKEVNLVSWNGRPAKIDIRSWQRNHEKCGKGIAITREEAEELTKLLTRILRNKSAAKSKGRVKKKTVVPQAFEPFYDELELMFGASPEECKTARNNLLKKYHPDKNAANIAFATRKTIKIKEAYDKIIAWWKEQ